MAMPQCDKNFKPCFVTDANFNRFKPSILFMAHRQTVQTRSDFVTSDQVLQCLLVEYALEFESNCNLLPNNP